MPKDKLKIAVLIRHYNRSGGGAERYCVELTERLAKIHDVSVLSQEISEHSDYIKFIQIKQWVKRPRFANQLLFSWMTRRMTKNQYDIVHSHDMTTHANIHTIHVPCVRSKWTEKKGIYKLARWLLTPLSPRKIGYLWLEHRQMMVARNKHIISVSEYLSKNIIASYPKLLGRITIAQPGITLQNLEESDNSFRQLNNISDTAFVLLFVAHRFKQKGLQVIVNALESIENNNIHVLVAGNGNPNEITFKSQRVQSNIHFIGTVKKMHQLYSTSDALIHPTLGDTFGMVALEAMSHKLPVIMSGPKFCGFSEHLNNNEALLLDNPKDFNELSSKISSLVNNEPLRSQLAYNGYNKSTEITWDLTLENTLQAYKKIN